jgi:hypothetical protein
MTNNEKMVWAQKAFDELDRLLSPQHGGDLHTDGCSICEAILEVRESLREEIVS